MAFLSKLRRTRIDNIVLCVRLRTAASGSGGHTMDDGLGGGWIRRWTTDSAAHADTAEVAQARRERNGLADIFGDGRMPVVGPDGSWVSEDMGRLYERYRFLCHALDEVDRQRQAAAGHEARLPLQRNTQEARETAPVAQSEDDMMDELVQNMEYSFLDLPELVECDD
jgi:hypothetical protein